ncbi:unnamed protein product [marine sediment metagenome]|uniref:Uncharacterized protein n=1 Tax=marine sediment metagenome TaxID=412755 RepID=X0XHP3_9ZZZZ
MIGYQPLLGLSAKVAGDAMGIDLLREGTDGGSPADFTAREGF